jgi:transcription elongation factor GreA
MSEASIPVTAEGFRMYQEKLDRLRTTTRSEVAERIRQAKEFGDISDNAEYESAKVDQAFVEGEIIQIERLLSRAKIIDRADMPTDEVSLGATVELHDTVNKQRKFTVTVVGTNEADIERGRISNESLVGRAILTQKKGATVEVKTPMGLYKYKIAKIRSDV